MRIKHPLTGAMVALITPMFKDGSVDFDALIYIIFGLLVLFPPAFLLFFALLFHLR
jgi:hypothetical protein